MLRQVLGGTEGERAAATAVELTGVAAGSFTPQWWERNTLHWLPDARIPFLAPRQDGPFRNIYAPSITQEGKGWRVFYGAWDGVESGNDRIYSVTTTDFLSVQDRGRVIEHGGFIHVCNVNVQKLSRPVRGAVYHMVATAYPDSNGQNKPIYFSSSDGKVWNRHDQPYTATPEDLIQIEGYPDYTKADLNGGNVLLRQGDRWLLYFFDFKNPSRTFLAEAGKDADPRRMQYRGIALEPSGVVNDVKILRSGRRDWYLMGLHLNGDSLYYSLATDPIHFPAQQTLFKYQSAADRYMVAIGWVCQGDRVLGALYGAGPVPTLDRNSLFARWLQKRIVLTTAYGKEIVPTAALGPDRQIISLPTINDFSGTMTVYAEDGVTRLSTRRVSLRPGKAYRI